MPTPTSKRFVCICLSKEDAREKSGRLSLDPDETWELTGHLLFAVRMPRSDTSDAVAQEKRRDACESTSSEVPGAADMVAA